MTYKGEDKVWHCAVCQKTSNYKTDITRHIEATHVEDHPGFGCELCGVTVKSRNALRQHKSAKHKALSDKFLY